MLIEQILQSRYTTLHHIKRIIDLPNTICFDRIHTELVICRLVPELLVDLQIIVAHEIDLEKFMFTVGKNDENTFFPLISKAKRHGVCATPSLSPNELIFCTEHFFFRHMHSRIGATKCLLYMSLERRF